MRDLVPGDFSYLKEYTQFISREEFWNEVLAQLNKDLGLPQTPEGAFSITTEQKHLQGENGAEAIVVSLQKFLPTVTPRLSELLYRIDLGEKYEAQIKNLPADLYYRVLAEMILKRIIQKVLTRKAFSDKKIQ